MAKNTYKSWKDVARQQGIQLKEDEILDYKLPATAYENKYSEKKEIQTFGKNSTKVPAVKSYDLKKRTWQQIAREQGMDVPDPVEEVKEVNQWKENPIKSAAQNFTAGLKDPYYGAAGILDMINGGKNEAINNDIQRTYDKKRQQEMRLQDINDDSSIGEIAGAVFRAGGQSLPASVVALLGAKSIGKNTLLDKTGTRIATGAGVAGVTLPILAKQALLNGIKNPNTITSGANIIGNQFIQAREDGATREEATKAALISGIPSTLIETSGGLENMDLTQRQSIFKMLLDTAKEEGLEEVAQYPVENMGQKITYDKDMPLFSTKETAVINPGEMAKAGFIGGLAGGLMGGGSAAINSTINKKQTKAINQEYEKVVNTLPEDSPIMERVNEFKNNNVKVTDEAKIWVINQARKQQNNFTSETDRLMRNTEPTAEAQQEDNKPIEQTFKSNETFAKTQNNASATIQRILTNFGIENINNAKEVKQNIYDFYKNSVISDSNTSKPIMNKNTGLPIEISRATVNQTFQIDEKYAQASDNEIKVAAMSNIVDLIQNGTMEVVNKSETPSSKVTFANIKSTLTIEGVPYSITLDVRRTDNGSKYFVHSLHTEVQETLNKPSGIINNGVQNIVKQNDPVTYDILDRIGQATGIKIRFVSTIYDPASNEPGFANGQYDPSSNTLEIALDTNNPYMVVAKHEITHMLQQQSPKLYREYKEFVISTMQEASKEGYEARFNSIKSLHERAGLEISKREIEDEIVADATELFLTNQDAINALAKENPTLGQKILDIIREFIKKVDDAIQGTTSKLMSIEQLRTAEQLWVNALNDVIENKHGNVAEGEAAVTAEQGKQYSLKDFVFDDEIASFTNERMNKIFSDYSASNPKYSKAYVAYMSPSEYLSLSTTNLARIESESRKLDVKQLGDESQNIFLQFDQDTNEITGHEGRHRMVALRNEGIKRVPVVFMPEGEKGKYNRNKINSITFEGQEFSNGKSPGIVEVKNIIPVSQEYKDELYKTFVRNRGVQFSLKEPVEETKDLIALHSLTESKLKGVLELGGFPVPSIAITKADYEHDKFGEISVVFSKDTIDPEFFRSNQVYTQDVYSKRIPRVKNKQKYSQFEKINEIFTPYFEQLEQSIRSYSNKWQDVSIEDAVDELSRQTAAKMAYLDSKGIKTKIEYKNKSLYRFMFEETIKDFWKKYKNIDPVELTNEKEKWNDAVREALIQDRKLLEEKTGKKRDMPPEKLGWGVYDGAVRDILKRPNGKPEKEIDIDKIKDAVNKKVNPKMKDFEKWLRDTISPYFGEKYFENDNGNKKPYTLEDLTEYMRSGNTKNKEKTLVYGMGQVIASTGKELKSISEIKAASKQLVNSEERAKYKKELEAFDEEVRGKITKKRINSKESFFDVFEDYYKALTQFLESKNSAKGALSKNGFTNVTEDMLNDFREVAKRIKETPAEYFEAKPQRSVGLDEIAAVVAPKTTDKELLQQLKDKSVKVVKYDENIEGDRLKAVNSIKNVKFQLKDTRDSKDVERLKKVNENLKEQFTLTKGVKLDKNSIKKLSRSLIKDYNSKYDRAQLETRMIELYAKIANNQIEYEDMEAETKAMARDIIENASVLNDTMHKQYSELRNTLRNTPITLAERYQKDFDVVGGFKAFKKRNLSRIKLSDEGMEVDQLYQELVETYPELFNADVANPADQLMLIEDVLSGLVPIYENPFNQDMNEAVEYLAVEIFEDFTSVPEARATFADRKKAELDKTKADNKEKIKVIKEKNKADIDWIKYKNKEKISQVIDNEKAKRDKEVDKLKKRYSGEAYKTWWKNKLKENDIKSHYQEMLAELRTEKNEKIEQTAARYKERISGIYESRKMRETKASIGRKVKRLDAMLRKPTEKKHINKILEKSIAELLQQINFETDNQKEATILKLRDLRAEYEKIAKVSDEEGIQATADPYIMEALEMLNNKRLTDMNLEELEILNNIVGYFEHMVQGYNKAFLNGKWQDISDKAQGILMDLRTDTPHTESAYGAVNNFKDMLKWGMVTPQMYFERMGETFYTLWDDLRASLDKKIVNTKIAQDYMTDLLNGIGQKELQTWSDYFWQILDRSKNLKVNEWTGSRAKITEFRVAGGTIELTPSQVMSLYLLFKREQARGHILGLGIKAAPIVQKDSKGIKHIKKQFEPTKVTLNDISKILGSMTKEQKRIADGIGVFMNTISKQWVNEATLTNYGYELAKEENYFPIKTDRDFLKSDFDNTNLDPTFTSMGFLKSTVKGAGNAIVIEDIFDVFTEHADKAATYNAFIGVTENIKKIVNYKTKENSIKQAMNKKYDVSAFNYLKKLMVDLQGGLRTDRGMPIINLLIKMNKRSMLGLNLRTVVQQPTSIIRASAMIDVTYLLKGIASKSDMDEMLSNSPIALWKSWGYFNLDTGRTMKDIILNTTPLLDKQYALIQKADDLTWTKIWNAVKYEIQDTMPGLKVGSKEFYEAVNERFSNIVDRTQVVDTVLHRSELMRDKDSYVKVITSFMSEPIKQYNIGLSAFEKYINNKTPENRNELIRSISSLIATTAVVSFTTALYDMAHADDDDDETLLDKWLGDIIGNVTGVVPIVKDINSIIQGYPVNRMEYNGITKVWRSFSRLYDYLEEIALGKKHKYQFGYILTDFIESISYGAGISTSNVTREIETIMRKYIKIAGKDTITNEIYKFMFKK